MSLNRRLGGAEYVKKSMPKNAKYDHVKTKLDTGCSLTKYMERLEEIRKNYRYQKDEIFKRLKVTTFAQLILQVASVSSLNENESNNESNAAEDLECLSECTNVSLAMSVLSYHQEAGENKELADTARSTLLSVISGVGELNVDRNNQESASDSVSSSEPDEKPYPDCPYLLLDVRDRDQYNRCHIISAHSFPIAMLSHTVNPYTKEALQYKNALGKIVIVYDEDERIASQAATIMCERGFENLYMLSGGLKVIAQKFPSGMTTGSIPTSCLSPPPSSKGVKCSAPQQPAPAAENRCRFTSDELARIQEQLEELLIPSSTNRRVPRRMSTSSVQSRTLGHLRSRTGGRGSARVQSSRPWK